MKTSYSPQIIELGENDLKEVSGGFLITGLVIAGVTLAVADRYVYHRYTKNGRK
jgi:hypothetical protein